MINIFKSIKNLTNSTESKIKNATNNEPLGPYNHELIELSRLTFDKSSLNIITSVLIKRLTILTDSQPTKQTGNLNHHLHNHNQHRRGSLSVRRSSSDKSSSSLSSSSSFNTSNNTPNNTSTNSKSPATIQRSYSLPTNPSASASSYSSPSLANIHETIYLQLLKTLTVILYLIQNGSVDFLKWVKANYVQYLIPNLMVINQNQSYIPIKYLESIKFKLIKILNLFDDVNNLNQFKLNFNKLKQDLSTPGIKRNSFDGNTGTNNANAMGISSNSSNTNNGSPLTGASTSTNIDQSSSSLSSSSQTNNNNTLMTLMEEEDNDNDDFYHQYRNKNHITIDEQYSYGNPFRNENLHSHYHALFDSELSDDQNMIPKSSTHPYHAYSQQIQPQNYNASHGQKHNHPHQRSHSYSQYSSYSDATSHYYD